MCEAVANSKNKMDLAEPINQAVTLFLVRYFITCWCSSQQCHILPLPGHVERLLCGPKRRTLPPENDLQLSFLRMR